MVRTREKRDARSVLRSKAAESCCALHFAECLLAGAAIAPSHSLPDSHHVARPAGGRADPARLGGPPLAGRRPGARRGLWWGSGGRMQRAWAPRGRGVQLLLPPLAAAPACGAHCAPPPPVLPPCAAALGFLALDLFLCRSPLRGPLLHLFNQHSQGKDAQRRFLSQARVPAGLRAARRPALIGSVRCVSLNLFFCFRLGPCSWRPR